MNQLGYYYLSKSDGNYQLPKDYDGIKGYTVKKWYLDSAKTIEVSEIDCSEGKDWYLYPEKTPNTYIIQYELGNGINAEVNPAAYTIEDNTIKLAPATRKGYRFERWYIISGGKRITVTEIKTNQCQNIKLYAEWKKTEDAQKPPTASGTGTGEAIPKAISIKGKVTAKSKGFLVKWKKQKSVSGYQIQYSTSKKFTKKTTKVKDVNGASKTKLTVKKLKAKKQYYVRIRTFVKLNGAVYYSKWSNKKTVRTKK